jgi:protein O-mannosyl-transferase
MSPARRGKRSQPQPPSPPRRRAIWLRAFVIAIAVGLAYANSLAGPFIFDDEATVVENPEIRDLRPSVALFPHREAPTAGRPVVNLSFAINYALGGLSVAGYHAGNILVHLTCALILFGLVRRTLDLPELPPGIRDHSLDLACAIALLWAVHPLNSEAVDYVTQRTESLMALFYLLTMYCALRRWTVASVVCCALGMASKESMVTAPIMVAIYDRLFLYESFRRALRERSALYAGLAATWILLLLIQQTGPRIYSAGFAAGVSPWTYLMNQAVMIVRYLRLALWPRSLVLAYGPPLPVSLADVLPQALLVVALLAATAFALLRRPRLGFLGVWFFLTLAPSSSIVPVATEMGAERRMYLPLAALAALAVVAAVRTVRGAVPRTGTATGTGNPPPYLYALTVIGAMAVLLAAQTMIRNREYRSPLVMAETVLARWPTPFAHALLGVELAKAGRHDEALPHLKEAAAGYPRAHFNLGVELFAKGDLDGALAELHQFVGAEPQLLEAVSARTIIGRALLAKRQYAGAEEQFRMVLTMTTPESEPYITAAGLVGDSLFGQEKFSEAVPFYRAYVAAHPDDAAAHRNYAMTLFNGGAAEAAASEARALLRLKPNDAAGHDLMGRILAEGGKFAEARAEFERAVQLDPNDEQARADLALLLRSVRAK